MKRLLLRLVLACVVGVGVLICFVLFLVIVDVAGMGGKTDSPGNFARRGDLFVSIHPNMIKQSFPASKSPGELRVFVLGSSEAAGSPYTQTVFDHFPGTVFGMPNEGGISTWLAAYLRKLLPGHPVRVVNAAKGGLDLAANLATFRQIVDIGQPDLVIFLEGNNERAVPQVQNFWLVQGSRVEDAVELLTQRFQQTVDEIVKLAVERDVQVMFLTVPNNLRDWFPTGGNDHIAIGQTLEEIASQGPARVLERLRSQPSQSPVRLMLLARCHEALGDYGTAREYYIQAKDLDESFLRTRSPWNDVIRRIDSPAVRVLDMERIVFGYAKNGIPGYDLFHDNCHLKLAGNRLVAFEIAKRLAADQVPGSGGVLPRLEDVWLATPLPREVRIVYWLQTLKLMRVRPFARSESMALNFTSAAHEYRKSAAGLSASGLWSPPLEAARLSR